MPSNLSNGCIFPAYYCRVSNRQIKGCILRAETDSWERVLSKFDLMATPDSSRINADADEHVENQVLVNDPKITAPIHLLPSELLSCIFEFCSWKDWKSPLYIGRVCVEWRPHP